jgi:hypothetical protein
MMLRHRVARLTENAVGVKVVFQPFKASIVGRKIALEILESVAAIFGRLGLPFPMPEW